MQYHTAEQMKDINEKATTGPCTIRIRDGWVSQGAKVWWRGNDGPEVVTLTGSHWFNAIVFPAYYQMKEPAVKITYED